MDEQVLIKKIKKNKDDDSFKIILDNYRNMIYSIINSYNLKQGDYLIPIDDLFQEGCICLYRACVDFDFDNGCKFSTFAYLVIKRGINKLYIQSLRTYMREAISFDNAISVDKLGILEASCVCEDPLLYNAKQNKMAEVENIINGLSKDDQDIIRLRLSNYSYKEIASLLNITAKKVDNRIAYLKRNKFFQNKI